VSGRAIRGCTGLGLGWGKVGFQEGIYYRGRGVDVGIAIGARVLLTPAMGAVLMSAGTVIVSVNAKLLTFR